jgi:hypothetical protein
MKKNALAALALTLSLSACVRNPQAPNPAAASQGGAISVQSGNPKFPAGIAVVGPTAADQDVIQNPNVKLCVVYAPWKQLNPSSGSYSWTYLDKQIAACAGKPVGVVGVLVGEGASQTPAWVISATGGTTVGCNGSQVVPNFLSATFQLYALDFYKALLTHLNGLPAGTIGFFRPGIGGGGETYAVCQTQMAKAFAWTAAKWQTYVLSMVAEISTSLGNIVGQVGLDCITEPCPNQNFTNAVAQAAAPNFFLGYEAIMPTCEKGGVQWCSLAKQYPGRFVDGQVNTGVADAQIPALLSNASAQKLGVVEFSVSAIRNASAGSIAAMAAFNNSQFGGAQ